MAGPFRFPFPDLVGQFIHNFVNGHVKIVFGILSMNIRPRHSQMNLHAKTLVRGARFVVPQNNVRTHDFAREVFKVRDFFRDVGVNGTGQAEVAGAHVNLHTNFRLEQLTPLSIEIGLCQQNHSLRAHTRGASCNSQPEQKLEHFGISLSASSQIS